MYAVMEAQKQKAYTILSLLAMLQLRLGDFHSALECYTKAADLAPGISGDLSVTMHMRQKSQLQLRKLRKLAKKKLQDS